MSTRLRKLKDLDELLLTAQSAVDALGESDTEYTTLETRLSTLEDEVSKAQKDLEKLRDALGAQRQLCYEALFALREAFGASYDDLYDGMEQADRINLLRDAVEDAAIL